MDTTAIIEQLEEEKERLGAAIAALTGAGPNHRLQGSQKDVISSTKAHRSSAQKALESV
jgi:hypothetical protein